MRTFAGLATVAALLVPAVANGESSFSHEAWRSVLEEFVTDDGMVDYDALSQNREDLDSYIYQVETTGPTTAPDQFPTDDHALAYYINAYNAVVVSGVLARGPEKKSVWRGLISGLSFFELMDITVDGRTTSLRDLEDDIIRGRFHDPRIHAAINCASMSCPRLQKLPFTGPLLQSQLDGAMGEFVNDPAHVRQEARTIYLSRIFDWFRADFKDQEEHLGAPGSLIGYINRFREKALDPGLRVRFLAYDKGINARRD